MWTGASSRQDPANWNTITYKYDPSGSRIKKKVEGVTTNPYKKPGGYTTTYLYDGDDLIAEYDGNNNLVRKLVVSPFG